VHLDLVSCKLQRRPAREQAKFVAYLPRHPHGGCIHVGMEAEVEALPSMLSSLEHRLNYPYKGVGVGWRAKGGVYLSGGGACLSEGVSVYHSPKLIQRLILAPTVLF
jgi:hypothetical protein